MPGGGRLVGTQGATRFEHTDDRQADFRVIKKERKKRHRVKRGETLSTIARKYGKSVRVLMRINAQVDDCRTV